MFSESCSVQLDHRLKIPNLVPHQMWLEPLPFTKGETMGLLLISLLLMMTEDHAKFTNQANSYSCSGRKVKNILYKNKMQKIPA